MKPEHHDVWKKVGVLVAILGYVVTTILWSADTKAIAVQARQEVGSLQAQVTQQNIALQQALQNVAVQQVQLSAIQTDLRDIKVRLEEIYRTRPK